MEKEVKYYQLTESIRERELIKVKLTSRQRCTGGGESKKGIVSEIYDRN